MCICMIFTLLPFSALADTVAEYRGGGHGENKPSETSYPLYIGIYIPDNTSSTIDWPNEPCVSNKTYRYVQYGNSLGPLTNGSEPYLGTWKVSYASDASTYINPTKGNFQDNYGATLGADGTLGVYNQGGIDSALFKQNFLNDDMKTAIVSAYFAAKHGPANAEASDYQLVPYVLKFEKSNEWHLDCVVLPKSSVTLSYDSNLPEGVSSLPTDVGLPDNHTAKGDQATINVNNMQYTADYTGKNPVEVTANGKTYTFAGWAKTKAATTPDYNLESLTNGSATITINSDTTLYAVWKDNTPIEVTFTGESREKVYTGSEQELTGITVNGLLAGHTYEGLSYSAKGTNVGQYDGTFSGDVVIKDTEGNDVTENYAITKTPGTLTITPITDEVVVTITGNTKTVTYDGSKQSVSGYEYTVTEGVDKDQITVALIEGKTASASGINPGTYYMELSKETFTVTAQNYSNIIVIVNDGWLKINPRTPVRPPVITDKITVTITGNSDSVVYDGTEHNVKGYTVEISDSRYTEKDFTFSGKDIASGVNAGSYEMGLKADQFKNVNGRFSNIEFVIKADGVLTITPMDLTITAGSKDGIAPVTCNEYKNTDLAKGDVIESVKITGEQLEPGQSPNVASDAVIKNAKGEDVTKNYNIKYVDGTLKAVEPLNKEDHFNYIVGYTDGTIRPNNNITRAEVAAIFFRLLTDEARSTFMTDDCSFSDVAQGAWCRRSIATLTNAEIISGYTDGTFKPNAPITRAELATIIARFAKLDVNTKTFSDINGHWAQKYIELAAGNGWIDGYTDGTFRPNQNIKRAETFAMINRVLDRVTESNSDLLPTDQMNMWSDNMDFDAWYYRDVQEATNNHKAERVGDSIYEKWTEKLPDIDWAAIQL